MLYLQTVNFGFVGLDDTHFFVDNGTYFRQLRNFFKGFLESGILDYYRPLLLGSFVLDAQVAGTQPGFYHFTNVLLHAGACVMVLVALKDWGINRNLALLIALLFAVHPLWAQAVAWVPGRNDSMLTLAVLASFHFFRRYYAHGSNWNLVWHWVLFAVACFMKETGLLLPLMCGLYLLLLRREGIFRNNNLLLLAGWVVVWGGYFALRTQALALADKNGTRFSTMITGLDALAVNYRVVIESVGKWLVPVQLSVFPTFSMLPFVLGFVAIALLLIALFITRSWKNPWVWFAVAWVGLFYVPSLALLIQVKGNYDYLEHRFYLPAVGLFFLAAFMLQHYWQRWHKQITYGLGTLMLAGFVATFVRCADFKDEKSYWSSAIASSPGASQAYVGLGNYHYKRNEMGRAAELFNKAATLDITKLSSLATVGNHYENSNDFVRAEAVYKTVLQLDSGNALNLSNYARSLEKQGRYAVAEGWYRKALARDSNVWEAWFGMGIVRYNARDFTGALANWQRALRLRPDQAELYTNIATVYYALGDFKQALAYVDQLAARGTDPKTVNPGLVQALEPYRPKSAKR